MSYGKRGIVNKLHLNVQSTTTSFFNYVAIKRSKTTDLQTMSHHVVLLSTLSE